MGYGKCFKCEINLNTFNIIHLENGSAVCRECLKNKKAPEVPEEYKYTDDDDLFKVLTEMNSCSEWAEPDDDVDNFALVMADEELSFEPICSLCVYYDYWPSEAQGHEVDPSTQIGIWKIFGPEDEVAYLFFRYSTYGYRDSDWLAVDVDESLATLIVRRKFPYKMYNFLKEDPRWPEPNGVMDPMDECYGYELKDYSAYRKYFSNND